ncbi:MAG: hypothetical protein AB7D57_07325 [Desulfovibrionaceae bacterium]
MIHENIKSVLPVLRELGGQVPEAVYERLRRIVAVLDQAAEDAEALERAPLLNLVICVSAGNVRPIQ